MSTRPILLAVSMIAVLAVLFPDRVRADCTCRFSGQNFDLGTMACIPHGPRTELARCDMNQNVTSWTFTGESCAISALPPPAQPHVHVPEISGNMAPGQRFLR